MLALLAPLLLTANTAVVTLHGTVVDAARTPIASARVSASPVGKGSGGATRSNARGEYEIRLAPGRYVLKAIATGFAESSLPVGVAAGVDATQDVQLGVPTFSVSVSVEAPGSSYRTAETSSATRTPTPLRDVPQSVTVTTRELMKDQLATSMADVVRYTPGITTHQGENNRDQVIVRGNSSSADFFLDGVRDDVQYYRDVYNLERVEILKGPNAMVFGRGGGGGVVNRVAKEAGFQPLTEAGLQLGSHGDRRVIGDVDRPLGERLAFRINGMYESADSFRDAVTLERYAVNPTLTFAPTKATSVTLGYERLHDRRVADRGIPSYGGRPADLDVSAYFGDPTNAFVRADVDLLSGTIQHQAGRVTLRNRTLFGSYDRGYQNFVPGAVDASGTRAALSAYNNATTRENVFNQTDVVWTVATGRVRHTLLAGAEIGRQSTDNFRNTGFFGGATSIQVPLEAPTISTPVTFRQGATDADNHLRTHVAAAYAQDQLALSPKLQLLGGVRFDRFDLEYHNNRTGDTLARTDDLVSPRAGVVYKPVAPLSLYGSYAVSYLPSSGDQFSSLTMVTQQVEPERFRNLELGAKWDVRSALALTAAVYRLDRTNTRSTDPSDPTRIVQTGSQRTNGFELGVTGRITSALKVAGGYAYQDAFVTSATAAARAGATVAQVPHHTLSLWSYCQAARPLAVALGVVRRTDMFAAIDDTVVLPGYTRVDAAVYYSVRRGLRLQANVENVLGAKYYANADNNNNISPGSPRALRVALTTAF